MAESHTSRTQRTVIWVIAIVMAVGTLGSFFIFMLPSANQPLPSPAQDDTSKQLEEFKKAQEERLAKIRPLEGYSAEAFDPATVTELRTEDIVVGEGKDVTETSTINANYFGWTSDGKLFDSTNLEGTATPVEFPLSGVIEGWTKGLAGAKEGSTRKLWIPAEMAYGEQAAAQGRPAGPLVFIVEIKSVK